MRITMVAVLMALVGCAAEGDEAMMGDGPDAGSMMAPLSGTGGSGGTGGSTPTAGTGGTGGNAGTGGTGGSGGSQPDAGAMNADTMPASSTDAQPAGPPPACDNKYVRTSACLTNGKVLHKDGRACDSCATYKSDGRTVEKQFVGCFVAAGTICVMSCDECK